MERAQPASTEVAREKGLQALGNRAFGEVRGRKPRYLLYE